MPRLTDYLRQRPDPAQAAADKLAAWLTALPRDQRRRIIRAYVAADGAKHTPTIEYAASPRIRCMPLTPRIVANLRREVPPAQWAALTANVDSGAPISETDAAAIRTAMGDELPGRWSWQSTWYRDGRLWLRLQTAASIVVVPVAALEKFEAERLTTLRRPRAAKNQKSKNTNGRPTKSGGRE